MRRKTRSSAKVLRWKASGPPSGVAAGSSPGAMDLVQQELPLKEGTAGLRVITVILAVMLLHVLFIGGIALYNLLGGGGKAARSGIVGQKSPASVDPLGARTVGKPGGEAPGAPTPSSPSASLSRRKGKEGQADASSPSTAEQMERMKGGKRRLRRVSTKESGRENGEESIASEAAPATRQRTGDARGEAVTVSPAQPQNEPPSLVPSASGAPRLYHVVRGDTLWKIARRSRVGLDDLMTVNRLTPASKLHIGQELQIPAAKVGRTRRSSRAAAE